MPWEQRTFLDIRSGDPAVGQVTSQYYINKVSLTVRCRLDVIDSDNYFELLTVFLDRRVRNYPHLSLSKKSFLKFKVFIWNFPKSCK